VDYEELQRVNQLRLSLIAAMVRPTASKKNPQLRQSHMLQDGSSIMNISEAVVRLHIIA
jgi:hypothetical protein